jgi:hypothetical protein
MDSRGVGFISSGLASLINHPIRAHFHHVPVGIVKENLVDLAVGNQLSQIRYMVFRERFLCRVHILDRECDVVCAAVNCPRRIAGRVIHNQVNLDARVVKPSAGKRESRPRNLAEAKYFGIKSNALFKPAGLARDVVQSAK